MAKEPLHDILCKVLGGPFPDKDDPWHCYFSPPDGKQMNYPCIVYKYTNNNDIFADNTHYIRSKRYTVTIIDEDPDSKISELLMKSFPYCTSDRNFAVDGLNHFVYTLFYSGPRIKEENKNE